MNNRRRMEDERTNEEMIITHIRVGELVRSGDVGDGVGTLVNGESGRDVGIIDVVGTVVFVGAVGVGAGVGVDGLVPELGCCEQSEGKKRNNGR